MSDERDLRKQRKVSVEVTIDTAGLATEAKQDDIIQAVENIQLSETKDSIEIYGSNDGGTTKQIIKTDSTGAVEVVLEQTNVTVTNGSLGDAVNIQDGDNSITIDDVTSNQSTTTVTASTTSVLLVSANSDRRQISIRNTSTKRLSICFFTPATTSTPFFLDKDESWVYDKWTGVIYGIWETGATGSAYITEESV